MKKHLLHILITGLLLFMAGCQKQGPVELVDDDLARNDLEIMNFPPPSLTGLDGTDVDSMLPPLITEKAFGQLVVAGSLFESPLERQEAVLARGIFFRREAPIIRGRDTLYPSSDVGNLDVDGIRLFKIVKLSPFNRRDTLGVQYLLGGRDGVGGRGLQYRSGYDYQWIGTGAGALSPFSITMRAADTLRITSPSVNDIISVWRNLPVVWTGGSSPLMIVISEFRVSGKPVPLFRFKVRVNRGKVVIPSTVLQLLPRDRTQFLFSFVSEKHALSSIDGFGDEILVQTVYSHSLLLRVTR